MSGTLQELAFDRDLENEVANARMSEMGRFDYHHGMPFDHFDHEDRDGGHEERTPRCNRCGSEDVRWRMQTGKWTLFSLTPGVLHVCKPSADDFGVVE